MSKHKLGKDLSLIYRYSQIYFDSKLKGLNLGSGQYIFLINILNNNGINQKELSELVKINKATTTRAVEKLVNENYVIKKTDENDKRAYNLYVTEKAESIRDVLIDYMDSWNLIMLQDFDKEEKELLFKMIDKISYSIIRHTEQLDKN